jgi:hypothetical protein
MALTMGGGSTTIGMGIDTMLGPGLMAGETIDIGSTAAAINMLNQSKLDSSLQSRMQIK